MWKKKEELAAEKVLDVDASMQGAITFKDPVNIRINGSFEGKLDTRGNLTIGENAKVRASVRGDRVTVAGKVKGDIVATQSVTLVPPAVVEGNITTPRISVAEGVIIEGHLSMLSSKQGVTPQPQTAEVSLSLEDVARYLEVEAQVVEEWARQRKIPAQQQENGDWIFKKADIDYWIQQERV